MARKGKKARQSLGADFKAVSGTAKSGDATPQGKWEVATGDAGRKGAADSSAHEAVDKRKAGRRKSDGGSAATVGARVKEGREEVRDEEGEEEEGARVAEGGASARAFAHMEAERGSNDSEASSGGEEGEDDEEEEGLGEEEEEEEEDDEEEEEDEPSCSFTPSLLGATVAYRRNGKPAYVLQLAAT